MPYVCFPALRAALCCASVSCQAALADIPRQAEAAEQRAVWEADITNYVIVSHLTDLQRAEPTRHCTGLLTAAAAACCGPLCFCLSSSMHICIAVHAVVVPAATSAAVLLVLPKHVPSVTSTLSLLLPVAW
jgi:hypothetical protein